MRRPYNLYCVHCLSTNRLTQIQTRTINGIVKHSEYEIGDEFDKNAIKGDHLWTAVAFERSWYLIDTLWGSQYVSGRKSDEWVLLDGCVLKEVPESMQLHYRYDEDFFLTNPEQLIYTHFPTCSEEWQLLARPVSLREFEEMAYLRPAFFHFGLELRSHRKCVLSASDGTIEIQLAVPENLRFHFLNRIWISTKGRDKQELFEEFYQSNDQLIELKRFVLMENCSGLVSCSLSFKIAGKYKIDFYCRDSQDTESIHYAMVCSYVIFCGKPKDGVQPLPQICSTEWGPGISLHEAGLDPITHTRGIIQIKSIETEIRFNADVYTRMLIRLHSNELTKEEMEEFAFYRFENSQAIVTLKLPKIGEYALNLYANNRSNKENTVGFVCCYLLRVDSSFIDPTPYPEIPNHRLGPTGELHRLGMEPKSHQSAYFNSSKANDVDVVFQKLEPYDQSDILAELCFQTDQKTEKLKNMVFIIQRKTKATLRVRFPKCGMYIMKIYGKRKTKNLNSDSQQHIPLVFVYMIRATKPTENSNSFPMSSTLWTEGCELIEPASGPLPVNEVIPFAVKVPKAFDISAITAAGKWTHFRKDILEVWRAEVDTGDKASELSLSAKLEENNCSYHALLVFQVLNTHIKVAFCNAQ